MFWDPFLLVSLPPPHHTIIALMYLDVQPCLGVALDKIACAERPAGGCSGMAAARTAFAERTRTAALKEGHTAAAMHFGTFAKKTFFGSPPLVSDAVFSSQNSVVTRFRD